MIRLLGSLVVVVFVVLVVGFFTGWFSFSAETQAGETDLSLRVNRGEIEKDVRGIGDKIEEQVEKATSDQETDAQTVEGTVVALDTRGGRLDLRTSDDSVRTFVVPSAAVIRKGADPIALDGIALGDRLGVTWVRADETDRVTLIEVL